MKITLLFFRWGCYTLTSKYANSISSEVWIIYIVRDGRKDAIAVSPIVNVIGLISCLPLKRAWLLMCTAHSPDWPLLKCLRVKDSAALYCHKSRGRRGKQVRPLCTGEDGSPRWKARQTSIASKGNFKLEASPSVQLKYTLHIWMELRHV